jgi:DoxX-like family
MAEVLPSPGPPRIVAELIRYSIAAAWLVFGVAFKAFDLVPRHRAIVARILGEGAARPATIVIGCAEAAIAVWVLSGWKPRACAAVQTCAIVAMNAIELTVARDLLLAPIGMVCANTVLLAAAWWLALRADAAPRSA